MSFDCASIICLVFMLTDVTAHRHGRRQILTPEVKSKDACGPEWRRQKDTSSPHAELDRLAMTEVSCMRHCLLNRECVAVDVRPARQRVVVGNTVVGDLEERVECWVHEDMDDLQDVLIDYGVVQLELLSRCNRKQSCPPVWRLDNDTAVEVAGDDGVDSDESGIEVMELQQCQNECVREPTCYALQAHNMPDPGPDDYEHDGVARRRVRSLVRCQLFRDTHGRAPSLHHRPGFDFYTLLDRCHRYTPEMWPGRLSQGSDVVLQSGKQSAPQLTNPTNSTKFIQLFQLRDSYAYAIAIGVIGAILFISVPIIILCARRVRERRMEEIRAGILSES